VRYAFINKEKCSNCMRIFSIPFLVSPFVFTIISVFVTVNMGMEKKSFVTAANLFRNFQGKNLKQK